MSCMPKAMRLTPAQVDYYMLVRAAFKEAYLGEKKIHFSKRMLARDREERMRWQMQIPA